MKNSTTINKTLNQEFQNLKNKNYELKEKLTLIWKKAKEKLEDDYHNWKQLSNNYSSEKETEQENEWLQQKITFLTKENDSLSEKMKH